MKNWSRNYAYNPKRGSAGKQRWWRFCVPFPAAWAECQRPHLTHDTHSSTLGAIKQHLGNLTSKHDHAPQSTELHNFLDVRQQISD